MRLSFGLEARQVQVQKLAPRMIQSMEILQLPVMALQERIEQELNENPVLELVEDDGNVAEEPAEPVNPDAPAETERELVVEDKSDNADDFERLLELDREVPEFFDDRPRVSSNRADEDDERKHDAIANIADRPESLNDYLLHQLGELELEPDMHKLCERIISSLDARDGGYLRSSLRDLMPPDATEADLEAAESALRIVQSLDPPGIAARDLRECLLLQLHPDMLYYEELRQLISDHLEDLKENRLPAIHKATGMTIEEIREVWDELRKLNPKPASGFSETFVPTVTPDVRIEQVDDGTYKVIVDEDRTPQLYISEYYRQRLATGQATPEEKEYIKRKITAAQWLIESIQQRRNTLTKVAQAIVDYQRRFLDEGPEHIEPLKMQQIAEQVGVHVTTVSRAVDDKWIQTPRGILPLRKFFVGGTRSDGGEDIAWDTIRIKLQDLIDREDKSNPYSDDQLVRELKKQGLNVARRTITKYREKMGIPSSRQRRDWSKAAAGTAARPSDVEAETVNRAAETPAEDEFDTDSSTGRQSGSDSREPAFAARTSAGRDTMFRDAASPDGAGRHGLARDAASGDGARRDSDYPQPAPARPALGGSHENGSAAALRSPAIRQEELGEQPLLNTREPSEYPPHGGPPMSAQRSDSLIAEAATTDKGNSAPTDRPPAPLPAARPGLPGVGAGVATMGPLSAGQSFAPLRSATEPVRELPPVRGANNDEAALREPESPASPREGDGFRPE